jgi:hypothetical protein
MFMVIHFLKYKLKEKWNGKKRLFLHIFSIKREENVERLKPQVLICVFIGKL